MFLHRGAVLRNSGSVYALVTQTGVQTKIIMNQGKYLIKFSKIETTLNYFLITNVCLLLTMAGCLSIANWRFNVAHYHEYLYVFQKPSLDEKQLAGAAFFSFYLILNSYVPLDLIIVIEIAKLVCTPFMEADAEMKQTQLIPLSGGKTTEVIRGFEAHTLNLHEDMAEVEYIFADKTGTLTQNELVFKAMAIVSSKGVVRVQSQDLLSTNRDL